MAKKLFERRPAPGTSAKVVLRARPLEGFFFRPSILEDRILRVPLTLTLNEARRLAVASQLLAGKRSPPTQRGIMETVRGLRHLQLDPTAAVAPSHLLVLWSRLGRYDPAELDALVRKGHLFEYCAFLYPTEEYPVHAWRMRHFGRWWQGEGIWPQRIRDFMEKNRGLRRQILTRLRREGSLLSRQFEGRAIVPWRSSGWYSGRNVSRMLEFLEWQGLIMVAGRREGQRLWDLTERVLPDWAPRQRLSEREFSRCVAEGMLRAAGVARARGDAWQWGPGTAPRPCARGIGTGRPGRTGRYPGRPPDPTGTLVRVVRCARPA